MLCVSEEFVCKIDLKVHVQLFVGVLVLIPLELLFLCERIKVRDAEEWLAVFADTFKVFGELLFGDTIFVFVANKVDVVFLDMDGFEVDIR